MKEFIEKLIERLEKLKEDAINEDCPVVPNSEDCEMEYSCASCYLTAAIRIVEELTEEYINVSGNSIGWIPVEERLPEESGYYLACVYNSDVDDFDFRKIWFANADDYIMDESEWRELYEFEIVTAWQPLPEPYKEQQKEIPTEHFTERFNRVM